MICFSKNEYTVSNFMFTIIYQHIIKTDSLKQSIFIEQKKIFNYF